MKACSDIQQDLFTQLSRNFLTRLWADYRGPQRIERLVQDIWLLREFWALHTASQEKQLPWRFLSFNQLML